MKTIHNQDCKRVFSRYDKNCTRCIELSDGAKPRAGWNDFKIEQDKQRSRAISEHYKNHEQTCDYALCGVPCVAFDN